MPNVPSFAARNRVSGTPSSPGSAGLTDDVNADSRQIAALTTFVNSLPPDLGQFVAAALAAYTGRVRSGNVLEFHETAEWDYLGGGTFTVDLTTNPPKPLAVVCITLAAGATIPALPSPFLNIPEAGQYTAGKEHRLMFNVAANGRIIYTISPMTP